jgi:hypothetical protein
MANVLLPSNISSNALRSPTNVENAEANRLITVPAATNPLTEAERNFALVTSLTIANKTLGAVEVNAKVINSVSSAYILYGVSIPAGTAFEVIQGNKFILKEGDSLYVWHNSTSNNVIDVIASYTIHVPNTPYTV